MADHINHTFPILLMNHFVIFGLQLVAKNYAASNRDTYLHNLVDIFTAFWYQL